MILPASHLTVFILLILGMLGWGLWANMFKSAGAKWRFELFYFDFAIGVVLAAVVLALTAGSLGFDGFSFFDDLRLAGKRQDVLGLGAGIVFNLGNMLLLAGISVAGISVAFPIGMGIALIVAALWNFAMNAGGNTTFLFIGIAVVAGAVALAASSAKLSSVVNPPPPPEGSRKKARKKSPGKAIALSLVSGILLGSFWRLAQMGMTGENGLGPYSVGFMFAIGVLFSTFVFNLFFMNLPVEGEPVDIAQYLRARVSRHGAGILAGILWYAGLIVILVVQRVQGAAAVSIKVSYAFEQAAVVVAALCGILLWHEFDGARSEAKIRVGLMLVLLIAGIGLSAAGIAPPPPLNP